MYVLNANHISKSYKTAGGVQYVACAGNFKDAGG